MKIPAHITLPSRFSVLWLLRLQTSNATGFSRVPTYKLTDLGTAHTSFGTGYVNAINFWGASRGELITVYN